MSKHTIALTLVGVLFLVVIGVAAQGSGVIQACVAVSGSGNESQSVSAQANVGSVRIVSSPADCRNGETAVSWNIEGPMGLQGPQGIQGPEGPMGPLGPMGLPGEPGIQGPLGPVGPQGLQGMPGETGPQGLQGEIGPAGPAGAAGPQGLPGVSGYEIVYNSCYLPPKVRTLWEENGVYYAQDDQTVVQCAAICPSGKVPLSGGPYWSLEIPQTVLSDSNGNQTIWEARTPYGSISVSKNYPMTNGWMVEAYNSAEYPPGPYILPTYAICVNAQ